MKNYSEQIKSPEWQKKRLEILQRDNFKCMVCGDDKTTLHVHHFYYKKNRLIWEYENIELLTICEDCHKSWHYIYNKNSGISSEYISAIVKLNDDIEYKLIMDNNL